MILKMPFLVFSCSKKHIFSSFYLLTCWPSAAAAAEGPRAPAAADWVGRRADSPAAKPSLVVSPGWKVQQYTQMRKRISALGSLRIQIRGQSIGLKSNSKLKKLQNFWKTLKQKNKNKYSWRMRNMLTKITRTFRGWGPAGGCWPRPPSPPSPPSAGRGRPAPPQPPLASCRQLQALLPGLFENLPLKIIRPSPKSSATFLLFF